MVAVGEVSLFVCSTSASFLLTSTPHPALQTFVKVVNYQHIMPTRYTLDVDLKGVVPLDAAENSTKRLEARKVRWWEGGYLGKAAVMGNHAGRV